MHIHEEASAVKNSDRGWQSPSLVDWSQEGCHHSVPHLGEGLSSCKTQGLYQIMYLLRGGTKTLFSPHYYLTALSLFLCSFVSLRSLITEIYPRASTVTRLRSQKWLRPKWLLLCQKKIFLVLFLWGPPNLCDYKIISLPNFRRQKSSTPDGSLEASSLSSCKGRQG